MATFGYTTIGTAGTTSIEGTIVGSLFTTPAGGPWTVTEIQAYITPSSNAFTTKCAIYTSAHALVANSETSVVSGVSQAGWYAFGYSGSRPVLAGGTAYILVAWCQTRSGTNVFSYDAGTTAQGHTYTATYGTWPSSFTPTTENTNQYSIYATVVAQNATVALGSVQTASHVGGVTFTGLSRGIPAGVASTTALGTVTADGSTGSVDVNVTLDSVASATAVETVTADGTSAGIDANVMLGVTSVGAIGFSGSSGIWTNGSAPDLSQALTIAGWFRTDLSTQQTLLDIYDSANLDSLHFYLASGYVWVDIFTGGSQVVDVFLAGSFATDSWHYVAVTFPGSPITSDNLKIYHADAGGTLTLGTGHNTFGPGSPTSTSTGHFDVGYDTEWAGTLSGSAACLRVWQAALTAEELAAEMASASAVRSTNLYGDWSLNYPSGLTSNGHEFAISTGTPTEAVGPDLATGLTLLSAVNEVGTRSDVSVALGASPVGASGFNGSTELWINSGAPDISQPLTVAGWFSPESLVASQMLFSLWSSDWQDSIHLTATNSGSLWASAWKSGIRTIDTFLYLTFPSGWFYAVFTSTGNTLTPDGLRVYFAAPGGTITEGTDHDPVGSCDLAVGATFELGSNYWGGSFTGGMACVRVWQAALTAEELNAEMNSATAVRTANLYADWSLDYPGGRTSNGHELTFLLGGTLTDVTGPSVGASPKLLSAASEIGTRVDQEVLLTGVSTSVLGASGEVTWSTQTSFLGVATSGAAGALGIQIDQPVTLPNVSTAAAVDSALAVTGSADIAISGVDVTTVAEAISAATGRNETVTLGGGAGNVAHRSSSQIYYGSRTNTTLSAPAGIQDGDVLLLWLSMGTSGGAGDANPPVGFTVVSGFPIQVDLGDFYVRTSVWYKIASGESGSYTVTHNAASTQAYLCAISGADPAAPFNPTPQTNSGMVTTTATVSGLTTVRDSCLIVFGEQDWGSNQQQMAAPAGDTPTFTERAGNASGGTTIVHIFDGVLATAGDTGSKSVTGGSNEGEPWTAALLSVQPGLSGGVSTSGVVAAVTVTISCAITLAGVSSTATVSAPGAEGTATVSVAVSGVSTATGISSLDATGSSSGFDCAVSLGSVYATFRLGSIRVSDLPIPYLINEGFEGTGAPSGWVKSGTVNYDEATIYHDGAQALCIDSSAASGYAYKDLSVETGHIFGKFWLYVDHTPTGTATLLTIRGAVANQAQLKHYYSTGALLVTSVGGSNAFMTQAIPTNTWIRIWFEYIQGTGSNATFKVWWATSDTFPGSSDTKYFAQSTNGTNTELVHMVTLNSDFIGTVNGKRYFDTLQVTPARNATVSPEGVSTRSAVAAVSAVGNEAAGSTLVPVIGVSTSASVAAVTADGTSAAVDCEVSLGFVQSSSQTGSLAPHGSAVPVLAGVSSQPATTAPGVTGTAKCAGVGAFASVTVSALTVSTTAVVSITGVSTSVSANALATAGTAVATVTGTSASASATAPAIVGTGVSTLIGVSASGSVGTLTAAGTGTGIVNVVGVSTSASATAPAVVGTGKAALVGVPVSGSASAPGIAGSGVATGIGVSVSGSAGSTTAVGSATVALSKVSAVGTAAGITAHGTGLRAITGDVSVGASVSGTLDFTRHAAITGAISLTASPAATLDFTRHAGIGGSVSLAATLAATLDFRRHAGITGSISLTASPAAVLDFTRHAGITGEVSLTATPAAALLYTPYVGAEWEIQGSVSVGATLASILRYTFHHGIVGSVSVGSAVSGSPDFTRHAGILGSVSVGAAVQGSPARGARTILGSVSIGAAVAGSLDFTRHAAIDGVVILRAVPAAVLHYHQKVSAAIIGDVQVGAVVVTVFVYHPGAADVYKLTIPAVYDQQVSLTGSTAEISILGSTARPKLETVLFDTNP